MRNHFFHYWGKADEKYVGPTNWHPLGYHCLDVAAVAMSWWEASPPNVPRERGYEPPRRGQRRA
ncbi:MAG: hypothetical protein IH977_10305 [Nitrospinae bacterium]|nr:hypothetical protein [Nitrospinota bacterium]